jgi:hypothetical protein
MPLSQRQLDDAFGFFDFHENPNVKGAIIQSADWIEHNLVRIPPPFPIVDGSGKPYKVIACHAKIADQLTAVLVELRDAGLTHLINTWDGCWCARHKTWDPKRGLSSHCWAIAVDINARLFPYGSTKRQDPRLIAAFARRGFEWGGNWHTPDPMHWEWVGNAVAQVPKPADLDHLILNDALLSPARLIDGVAWAPIRPLAEALGATVTYHPEQAKVYVYDRRGDSPSRPGKETSP